MRGASRRVFEVVLLRSMPSLDQVDRLRARQKADARKQERSQAPLDH
jgi:hypothetical protein